MEHFWRSVRNVCAYSLSGLLINCVQQRHSYLVTSVVDEVSTRYLGSRCHASSDPEDHPYIHHRIDNSKKKTRYMHDRILFHIKAKVEVHVLVSSAERCSPEISQLPSGHRTGSFISNLNSPGSI